MALGIAAFLVPDRAASAEPVLVQSTPANGTYLTTPPTRLTFRFNVPIRRFGIAVTLDGETVPTAEPIRGAGPEEAFVELLPVQDGVYQVTWEAYGQDSSLTQGTLGFTVGPPLPQVSTDPAPPATDQTETSTTGSATSTTTASTTLTSVAPTSAAPVTTGDPTTTRGPTTTIRRPARTTTTNTPTSTSTTTASVMTTTPKPTGTPAPSALPDTTTATANRPLPGSAVVPTVPSGPEVYPRTGRDRSAASTPTPATRASPVESSAIGEPNSTVTQVGPERSTRPPRPLDQPTATALSIPIRGVATTAVNSVDTRPRDTLGAGESATTSTSSTPSTVPENAATRQNPVPTGDAPQVAGRRLGLGGLRTVLAGLGLASVLTAFGAWFGRPTGAGLRRSLLVFTSLVTALVLAIVGFGVLAERNALPHDRGLLSIKIVGGALLLLAVVLRALIARRVGGQKMATPLGPRLLLNEVGFASMSLVVTAMLMAR